MSKKPALEIETTLGTIQIKKSGFTAEGYPGFVFSINHKGKCVDIALLEVDESDPDEEPVVKSMYGRQGMKIRYLISG